ncbi:glycoside-pentoside-hexuronide (GPH):cation symporter [Kocuria massiliensis]|uniref:glycoside-pentoside-hexuronide (GPH):cation symporter n=1 Tax=Kocuria massiliensis TaxID=1926282 RepID=UPI0022B94AFB|nr:glycoside-pentoside-hexuronide (GPH):cation symporter [Kocuria massiliensis]
MSHTSAPETAHEAASPTKGATGKLPLRAFLGYAAGDAGNNLAFNMVSTFLLLYYTDVVGIPAAYAAPIFLIVRIWDGIGDVIVGRWVDKTTSRWGKFRPWILWSCLPLMLCSVWVFSLPEVDSLTMKLFWAYLSYGVMMMFYSMVNIPYGSLASAMTQAPVERAKLATFRTAGSQVAVMLIAIVVAPMVQRFSSSNLYQQKVADLGGEANASQAQLDAAKAAAAHDATTGLQGSLTMITLVFVILGVALYVFTFLTAKERVVRPPDDQVSFTQAVGVLAKNKALIWLSVGSLIVLTSHVCLSTMGIYFARDVMGNAALFSLLTIIQTASIFVAAPFIGRAVARFGKRFVYLSGAVSFMLGGILVFVCPPTMPWLACVAFFFLGLGIGLLNTLMWAMEADTVEYGEWKTGRRTEGTTYAVFSFVRKLGQAFGGAAAAGLIGLTGYVGGAAVQSEGAVMGIRLTSGILPAALCLIGFFVMLRYPLTDALFSRIVEENETRKQLTLKMSGTRAVAPDAADGLPDAPADAPHRTDQ